MKKPKIPKPIKRTIRRRQAAERRTAEALADVPRITNETVAEHREEVLSSARKYIYPLQHSRRRVVTVSATLLVAAVVIFFSYCALALYRFQSTSGFIYDVSRVLPFPVAKVGSSWVGYENYLFELRRDLHYYQTQAKINFADPKNKAALANYKQQALQRVINDAYVKQLAAAHGVKVSGQEVNDEVALLQQQNRLGSNPQALRTVLSEYWGWNINDFKRELSQQLLSEKVVSKLDTATWSRADQALKQLQSGADFGQLAGQISDDATTKGNGGQYSGLVAQSDPNVPPQVTAELFKLKPGQTSGIINTGYSLEIVKVIDQQGDKVHAAHIQFNFGDISTYIKPLQKKNPPHAFIKV